MLLFYTPTKAPENLWFSGVFRGYKMGTLGRNGIIHYEQVWLFSDSFCYYQLLAICICVKLSMNSLLRHEMKILLLGDLKEFLWFDLKL